MSRGEKRIARKEREQDAASLHQRVLGEQVRIRAKHGS